MNNAHNEGLEIFLNTSLLSSRIINAIRKHSSPINITPTSINNATFYINLPEFTNLKTTVHFSDFNFIFNSKINSRNWKLIYKSNERNLFLKYTDLSGFNEIERVFKTFEGTETLSLTKRPCASISMPKNFQNLINKLDFQQIELCVLKNKLKIKCEDLEKIEAEYKELDIQMENQEEIRVLLDLKSLISSCNDFDRQVICFFRDFVIVYSYFKEIIMASFVNSVV